MKSLLKSSKVGQMFQNFLEKNKKQILLLSEEKTKSLAGFLGGSEQLKVGLP